MSDAISGTSLPLAPVRARWLGRGSGWWIDAAVLALVAAAFDFAALGRSSLWTDELFSLRWSGLDLAYLLGPGNRLETNPAGYYLLLKGWMALFGNDLATARALSGVAGVGCVVVVYALARRLGGRMFGVFAGLFLALDPAFLLLARQARGYTLLALLCGLALVGLSEALRPQTRWRFPAAVLFAIASIATFQIHYTAIVFIAACFAGVGLHLLATPARWTMRPWLFWIAVGVAVAVGVAPGLLTATSLAHSANIDWIDPPTPVVVWQFFRELVVGRARPGLLSDAVAVALLLVLPVALWRRWPAGPLRQVMVVIPAAFLLILLVVSFSRPLFIARAAVWLSLPIAMARAWLVLGFPARRFRIAGAVALLLLLGGLSAKVVTRPSFEEWRDAAHLVATDPACAGPLVTVGPYVMEAEFYQPRLSLRPRYWMRLRDGQADTAESTINTRITAAQPLDPAELVSFLDTHPGAALIYRNGNFPVAAAALGNFESRMAVSQEFQGLHVSCR